MNTANLAADLLRFAGQDLAAARRNGGIIVAGTKVGNVSLTYDTTSRTYQATRQGNAANNFEPIVMAFGARRVVAAALAGAYMVVEE